METEIEPEDNITRARDILRKDPLTTPKELKEALGLANNAVAVEILKAAQQKEKELKQKLAAEDAAAQTMGDKPMVEQKIFLRGPDGHSHRLTVRDETPRMVVMEFEDPKLEVTRG